MKYYPIIVMNMTFLWNTTFNSGHNSYAYEVKRVSIMINTIEQALLPYTIVSFIFGFGILKYPINQSRIHLSIFYILTIWSVYVYMFYYTLNFFLWKNSFHGVLSVFLIIMNMLVTAITIIKFLNKYKKFRKCIRKLSFVDNTLEMLGTPKEYHRMRNNTKWIFSIWFIIICITWFIDSLWFIEKHNDIRAMFIPIVTNYPFYVNIFMDIMYMFLLSCIGDRLEKINKHIEELSETEEYGLRCAWKKSLNVRPYMRGAGNRKHVLWITMHLHSELCRIAYEIHDLFDIHMTFQMMSYFILLIAMLYFQYHIMLCLKQMYGSDSLRLKLLLSSDLWFAICIIKVILFNHICESVYLKAKKTKEVVHKLTNLIYFTEVRKEIIQFALQISLRPLKFSGLGLFSFGHTFIRKFFTWILTTVVFLLQIDSPFISRIITSNRKNMMC